MEEEIQQAKELLAISNYTTNTRYSSNFYIIKSTGQLLTRLEALLFLQHSFSGGKLQRTTAILLIENLNTLSEKELKMLNKLNKKCAFFKRFFDKNWNKKILLSNLFIRFENEFGNISVKKFNNELNFWLVENRYKYQFFNQRQKRKILVEN